jgi:hypothetical protein
MWILFLISFSAFALDLRVEYAQSGPGCTEDFEYGDIAFQRCGEATYYLEGNCEAAVAEVRKFSEATPKCDCEKGNCKTILTPHLSSPIQSLLRSPNPYNSILNCHNTLLHALGFKQGYKMSGRDLEYLLASPYCTKREGRPGIGDVIVVRNTETFALQHSFFALSDTLSFNKTNVGKHKPYELVKIDDYYRKTKIPLNCQFITKVESERLNCQTTSSAYRCDVPADLKNNLAYGDLKDLVDKLDDCGYQQGVLGKDETENLNDLVSAAIRLSADKLELPSMESVPQEVLAALEEILCEDQSDKENCLRNLKGFKRKQFEIEVRRIFLLAADGIKSEELEPEIQKIVDVAKRNGFYSKLPMVERLPLSMLYLGQTGELEGRYINDPVRSEFLQDNPFQNR